MWRVRSVECRALERNVASLCYLELVSPADTGVLSFDLTSRLAARASQLTAHSSQLGAGADAEAVSCCRKAPALLSQ